MEKILIWGIGVVANQLIHNGVNAEIVGFIETNKTTTEYQNKRVYGWNEILPEYDYIVVASTYASDIYQTIVKMNIDLSKIIFLYSIKEQKGFCEHETLRNILGERNFTDYCSEFGIHENTFLVEDKKIYQKKNKRPNFDIKEEYMWPIISDKYAMAGTIGNYFWQDLWAARLIYKTRVKKHFDIGSRIDGFIAHLLAMNIDVTLIDVREFPSEVENLHTIVDDATLLKQVPDNSLESMSALCSLEHFGLGRYGDAVDPEACFKCFKEIQKKIKLGGHLYISLPIGKERVEFNAHRVFFASTIIEEFSDLELVEFSCAAEGKVEYQVDIHKYDNDSHNGEYRYGLFHFVKKN